MPLNVEKSGEQRKEKSKEWLVNMDPNSHNPERQAGKPLLPVLKTLVPTCEKRAMFMEVK